MANERIKTEYYVSKADGTRLCKVKSKKQGENIIKRKLKILNDTLNLLEMFGTTMPFANGGEDEAKYRNAVNVLKSMISCWESAGVETAEEHIPLKNAPQNKYRNVKYLYAIVFEGKPDMVKYAQSEEQAHRRIDEEIRVAKKAISSRHGYGMAKFYANNLEMWEHAKVITAEEYKNRRKNENGVQVQDVQEQ